MKVKLWLTAVVKAAGVSGLQSRKVQVEVDLPLQEGEVLYDIDFNSFDY
jgi:hypothetical protein